MTPGRRSLLIILQRTRREHVAARCGVARSTVDDWCSGRAVPGSEARAALDRDFGIRPESWALPRCREGQR
jgi:transcriptional regulator with XRE-family HTH domain